MDENKLRIIVKEVVSEAVSPIKQQLDGVVSRLDGIEGQLNDPDTGLAAINRRLDDPDTGLAAINRRLDSNTAAVVELEATVNGYGDMYKINNSNIRRMEKRLEPLEDKAGVNVPPEYQLEPLSEAA